MTQTILTMFATFVLFVGGVVTITEAFNKLFRVEGQTAKLIVSWAMSIALAVLGFVLHLGMFADFGPVDSWQAWVKCVLTGVGCALAANKIYDRDEIWNLLQKIFPLFGRKK